MRGPDASGHPSLWGRNALMAASILLAAETVQMMMSVVDAKGL
jgi:hypothetical protein